MGGLPRFTLRSLVHAREREAARFARAALVEFDGQTREGFRFTVPPESASVAAVWLSLAIRRRL